MKIGVFDSGIGGLTVLKELVNSFPNNEYIYLADMLNNPYGDKSEEQIRSLTKKILEFMKEKKADVVVCACGTISGISRGILKIFSIDNHILVYDMTEGIRQALMKANKQNILLLATKATIKKGVFARSVKYIDEVQVVGEACPEFVKLLEADVREEKDINKVVEKHLEKVNNDIDAIVLGCTHYPLLKDNIKKYVPNVDIFEAGKCLVERRDLKDVLRKIEDSTEKIVCIYTTKMTKTIEDMSRDIFGVVAEKVNI